AIATVAGTNPSLSWGGVVPAGAARLYFWWQPGGGGGAAASIGQLGGPVISTHTPPICAPFLVFSLLVVPASRGGGLFLGNDYPEVSSLRDQLKQRGRRAEQITRMASEYMRVVYEMTEVLSASKLEPKRVLASAVEFAVEALKRVGMEEPLYCAILLF